MPLTEGAERLGICLAADANFELGLRVALFSALDRLSVEADVYIVDGGLTAPQELAARALAHPRCAQCEIIRPELQTLAERLAGSSWEISSLFNNRFGVSAWLRILLPDLLANRARVIYLDADTLVRADLVKLWHEGAGPHPISAVRDFSAPVFAQGFPWASNEPWFDPTRSYFNSGVLVLNLELLRRRNFVQLVAQYVSAGNSVAFPDQDAINAVLANEVCELDPRWNVQQERIGQPGLFFGTDHRSWPASGEALHREARIVHFTNRKPWEPEGVRANRWSVTRHVEYLLMVQKFGGYTSWTMLRAGIRWLGGFVTRVSRALRKRVKATLRT